MNNNTLTKEQQEFIAYLKKKYKDLDEKKLKQLKESGQLEKDVAEFKKAKEQAQKAQTQKAAHGAKLDYIKAISHKCPEGQELYYFKVGGKVKCGCIGKKLQEGGKAKESAVDKFKKALKGVKIEPSDTIHTKKFGIRNLNRDKNLPKISHLTNDEYSKLSNDEQLRVYEKDAEREAKAKAKKLTNNNSKKKYEGGGSLTAEEIAKLSVLDFSKYAPTTKWRYNNGTRINDYSNDINYANNSSTRGVVGTGLNYWSYTYPSIVETVIAPGDTMYVETPEQKRFSLRGTPVKRTASTKNPNGNEYNILKRRFNEAWNLAK